MITLIHDKHGVGSDDNIHLPELFYASGSEPPHYPVPSPIFLAYCWEDATIAPVNRYWQP